MILLSTEERKPEINFNTSQDTLDTTLFYNLVINHRDYSQ